MTQVYAEKNVAAAKRIMGEGGGGEFVHAAMACGPILLRVPSDYVLAGHWIMLHLMAWILILAVCASLSYTVGRLSRRRTIARDSAELWSWPLPQNATDKLLKWVLFVAVFSVVPFVASWLSWVATHHTVNRHFFFYFLWERGELAVLSTGFAADGLSECLVRSGEKFRVRLVSAIICTLAMVAGIVWFAFLQWMPTSFEPSEITHGSLTLFVVTLTAAFVCKAVGASLEDPAGEGKVIE